jgi:hypothetical protein
MMENLAKWLLAICLIFAVAGCTQPAPAPDQGDLDRIVAATLAAVDTLEFMGPSDTPAPTATQPVPDQPTSTPTTELSPTPMSDTEQIKAALIDHLEVDVDPTTITVSEIEGSLARGGLSGGYFLAAKESGTWVIVHDGQANPSCAVIEPYNFSLDWVPECVDQNGDVVQRSEPEVAPEIADLGSPTWADSMDSRGRWYLVSTENTLFTIENGALVMTALEPGFDEWGVAASADQTDFYMEVSARTGDDCSGLDRYGVIFRAPDPSRGYVFQLSCDGRFRLYLWDGSEYTGLQNWLSSNAIRTGPDKENKLGVMVVGEDVSLYANDQELGTYLLEEYDQGRFGLVIGASDTDNFEVRVETVRFWELPAE